MDIYEKANLINAKYIALCDKFHIPVQIHTINDPDSPKHKTNVEDGVTVLLMNLARIPFAEYESHVGYFIGKILLPQLHMETERLILRRYLPEDADKCFSFLSNKQDAYMDCCKEFSIKNEDYYDRVAMFGQRETQYMIVLKYSNELIGTINLFEDNSRAVDAMEIGYSIAHAFQRKGYAFEALSALLTLVQKELRLTMVTAGVLPENTASQNLLMKLGFQKEGLRHNAVWHEGLDKPVDLVYYYRDRQES